MAGQIMVGNEHFYSQEEMNYSFDSPQVAGALNETFLFHFE
jgi:hypothetical protein